MGSRARVQGAAVRATLPSASRWNYPCRSTEATDTDTDSDQQSTERLPPHRPDQQVVERDGEPLPPRTATLGPMWQPTPPSQPGQKTALAGTTVLQDDSDPQVVLGAAWPGPATRLAALRELCLAALLPYLATRVGLVLIGLLADYYLLPLHKPGRVLASIRANTRFPGNLQLMWQRFDSGFYLGIAKGGYDTRHLAHPVASWAFYPLYPLAVSMVSRPFGYGAANLRLAAILVANAAGLAAAAYLYALARREFGARVAGKTVLYLALFPTSFYLSAIYPESLFLLCAVACIYYTRGHRWWLAGIFGGLAALGRAQGVLLLLPVAWELLLSLREDAPAGGADAGGPVVSVQAAMAYGRRLAAGLAQGRTWLALPALALIPGGLLLFLAYGKHGTGSWLVSFDVQRARWGRYYENPWTVLANAIQHPHAASPMDWNFWSLNMAMVAAFLGFVVWAFRRLPSTYGVYTLVMVLLPLSSSRLNSISRYYLPVFPALILLALWSDDPQGTRHGLIVAGFAALLALLMSFFVLGLPAIA